MPDARRWPALAGTQRGPDPARRRSWPPPRSPRRGTPRPRPRRPRRSRRSGTFVGMPAFPAAARAALADAQLRHNLAHATHTIRDKRAGGRRGPRWEELRLTGAAIKDDPARPRAPPRRPRGVAAGPGAVVHWANDAAEANEIVARITKDHEADEVVKVKSMATAEIGLNEALAEHGIAAWETDLAELIVQLGEDLPSHILVPAIHRNRAEIREIFRTKMAAAGRPAPSRIDRQPGRAGRRGPAAPAREVPARQGGGVGRELRDRRDRHARRGRVRGQRPDVPDPARGADLGRRHREGGADLGRPGRVPPAAAAVVDGGADEPVHLPWSGVTPGDGRRRCASYSSTTGGPARWPTTWAARRCAASAARPASTCARCTSGRAPTARSTRADRRDPQPADEGDRCRRADRLAAVRLLAVRCLLRGLPGPHRHPRGPGHLRSKVVDGHRGDTVPKARRSR